MATTIHIATERPYDVVVGRGILDSVGQALAKACPNACKALVVTDDNVAPLYAARVKRSLEQAGMDAVVHEFPHGEPSKTVGTWQGILTHMAEAGLTRTDVVVALGGGVTGDVAGFAAASYMRGVDFVQVPTSLLADVDSSVGGKTAVDLPQGKNLVGAFWQPRLVWADVDCLGTLSPAFAVDGMGEVLKCGVLGGDPLFQMAARDDESEREELIARCVRLKDRYVSADEKEHGARRFLNLGHTFGHAVELLSGFSTTHGQCVSMGTVLMARACERRGIARPGTTARVAKAARGIGLATKTRFSARQIAHAALHDKKRRGNQIVVVLVRDIGDCFLKSVPVSELEPLAADALAPLPSEA